MVKTCVPSGVPGSVMVGVGSVVPFFPAPHPIFAERQIAVIRRASLDRPSLRRGTASQNRLASAAPPKIFHLPSNCAFCVVLVLVLRVAAVVVICRVVLPPPVSVTGLKEQVASAFDGGEQPKVTVPLNPPTIPSNITTFPL